MPSAGPGLGTLIRTADWFGFGGVFITEDTVDPWNAKTVQAHGFHLSDSRCGSSDGFLHESGHFPRNAGNASFKIPWTSG